MDAAREIRVKARVSIKRESDQMQSRPDNTALFLGQRARIRCKGAVEMGIYNGRSATRAIPRR